MNKFGFISAFLTLVLFLFQYIPLGLYFGSEGPIYTWLSEFFGFSTNSWINSFVQISIEIFSYQGKQIFLFGMSTNGTLQLWFDIHFLTFLILFIITPLTILLAFIGCAKENTSGKKLINTNFFLVLLIFLYCIIGIPIYTKEILGIQFGFMEIFFYLHFGFYILLIDLIMAAIAKSKHPLQDKE